MSRADRKLVHERVTFERFCTAAGLEIVPGTIQQTVPPAPDLTVEIAGAGGVAFQLVRINDDDQLMRLSLMQQTPRLLENEFAALDAATHAAFSNKYSDALITVGFKSTATLPERRKALPFVWQTLMDLPGGYAGIVDLYWLKPPPAIDVISVGRWNTGGRPRFRTQTLGFVLPLRIERITEKLRSKYDCNEPLELLAYVENGELAHFNDRDDIVRVVTDGLPGSQFRRVWVFEGLPNRVALSLP
jgi:hypothetical protein